MTRVQLVNQQKCIAARRGPVMDRLAIDAFVQDLGMVPRDCSKFVWQDCCFWRKRNSAHRPTSIRCCSYFLIGDLAGPVLLFCTIGFTTDRSSKSQPSVFRFLTR